MNTKHIDVRGTSVAVHETTGGGPPIVLCHGNSSSSQAFLRQLDGELGRKHRLVAIDLPGHGASGRAADPDATYTLPGYAAVLCALTKELGLGSAVFVGWSLGGHIVLEASPDLPDAAGFFICGTPPIATLADFARASCPGDATAAAFAERPAKEDVRRLVECFVAPGVPVPDVFASDFERTDGNARTALAASVGRAQFRDEVRLVAERQKPLAIIHGELDRLFTRTYFDELTFANLWRGAIQDLPGVGHTPQWEAPAAFDALLEAFAADCAKRK
jgi:pimeloyl-ACP methyl ester carboxylesterase